MRLMIAEAHAYGFEWFEVSVGLFLGEICRRWSGS
jgi:hypothetical protein